MTQLNIHSSLEIESQLSLIITLMQQLPETKISLLLPLSHPLFFLSHLKLCTIVLCYQTSHIIPSPNQALHSLL